MGTSHTAVSKALGVWHRRPPVLCWITVTGCKAVFHRPEHTNVSIPRLWDPGLTKQLQHYSWEIAARQKLNAYLSSFQRSSAARAVNAVDANNIPTYDPHSWVFGPLGFADNDKGLVGWRSFACPSRFRHASGIQLCKEYCVLCDFFLMVYFYNHSALFDSRLCWHANVTFFFFFFVLGKWFMLYDTVLFDPCLSQDLCVYWLNSHLLYR